MQVTYQPHRRAARPPWGRQLQRVPLFRPALHVGDERDPDPGGDPADDPRRNLFLFRQAAGILQVLGVVLPTAGVVLVVCRADPQVLLRLRFSVGDLLVLCGVVGWALYTALLRLRPRLDPRSFLAATFCVGALVMFPLAVGEWARGKTVTLHPSTFAAFAYVTILPSRVGYLLYNVSVGMIGSARRADGEPECRCSARCSPPRSSTSRCTPTTSPAWG